MRAFAIVGFPLLLAIPAVTRGAADPKWRVEAPLPQPVAGHAAALRRNTCWIAGGSWWEGNRKRIGTAIFRGDGPDAEWSRVGEIEPGFAHGGFATDGPCLWLAGGLDERGVTSAVRAIDLSTAKSTALAQLPEPRVHCGAAFLDGALWVIGGSAKESDFAHANRIGCRIDALTGEVSILPTGPALISPLVLVFAGKLHVLPGSVWSAERGRLEALDVVHIFSPVERRWTTRPLAGPLPRSLTGVTLDERRALVCGGVELSGGAPAISRGAWIYDAVEGTFQPIEPLPEPRLGAAVVRDGQGVLVLGGEDGRRSRAATRWRRTLADLAAPR